MVATPPTLLNNFLIEFVSIIIKDKDKSIASQIQVTYCRFHQPTGTKQSNTLFFLNLIIDNYFTKHKWDESIANLVKIKYSNISKSWKHN